MLTIASDYGVVGIVLPTATLQGCEQVHRHWISPSCTYFALNSGAIDSCGLDIYIYRIFILSPDPFYPFVLQNGLCLLNKREKCGAYISPNRMGGVPRPWQPT